MPAAESEEEPEWTKLYSGPNGDVWIHSKCKKEMGGLSAKDRSKIETCMEDMYCTMEQLEDIPATRLNRNEGRHKVGHKDYRVQAFKNYQGRVYGVEGSIDGKRTFFAACAAVKKQDRADPNEFERAVTRVQSVSKCVTRGVLVL